MIRLSSFAQLSQLARPVVLTVGFFDGVHLGHQALLNELQQVSVGCDALSLAITFPNLPRAFHTPGLQPSYLTLPREKLLLLEELGLDAVLEVAYDASIASQTALEFFSRLLGSCDVNGLVLGYDTSIGSDQLRSDSFADLSESLGVPVVFGKPFLKDNTPVKSSHARNLVLAGKMSAAAEILGRPYFVLGTVKPGKGLGRRQLGIPTANLYLDPEKLSPPRAIYAGRAILEQASYPAAIAVMTRRQAHSTVLDRRYSPAEAPGDYSTVIETHLDGFDGDLYGCELRLEFLQLLRAWHDFSSVADLRAGILQDIQRSRDLAGINGQGA